MTNYDMDEIERQRERERKSRGIRPENTWPQSVELGKDEKPDQVYFGNYWQKGGRYLCIPCDGSTGKTFVTEIDLSAKFFELFGKQQLPITALGIAVDVQKTEKENGRHSKYLVRYAYQENSLIPED